MREEPGVGRHLRKFLARRSHQFYPHYVKCAAMNSRNCGRPSISTFPKSLSVRNPVLEAEVLRACSLSHLQLYTNTAPSRVLVNTKVTPPTSFSHVCGLSGALWLNPISFVAGNGPAIISSGKDTAKSLLHFKHSTSWYPLCATLAAPVSARV